MKVSVIVPVIQINNNIKKDLLPALKKQSLKDFELILVVDKKKKILLPKWARQTVCPKDNSPAAKRNWGVRSSKAKIIAFIDDDAFPDKKWLEKGVFLLNNSSLAAVCGPGITPKGDSLEAKISGYFWQSFLGPGLFEKLRVIQKKTRFVDDYPSFNLMVKKNDFNKVGGFDVRFWPGEDSQLCHDFVYSLGKKILYHPKLLVYHHRRKVFIPHLKQLGRYGFQRGRFAILYPANSLKLFYFIPSFFVLGLFLGGVLPLPPLFTFLYQSILFLYLFLLLAAAVESLFHLSHIMAVFLLIPTIFLSHLCYGIQFIRGFCSALLTEKSGRHS